MTTEKFLEDLTKVFIFFLDAAGRIIKLIVETPLLAVPIYISLIGTIIKIVINIIRKK